MKLSVVIPVYNGAATLPQCLDAAKAALPEDSELVVVDDASTDETPQILARAGVRALRNPENRGTSASRNRGWREARGELVAFVDADVVLKPEALRRMVAVLDAEPGLSGVNGVLSLDLRTPGLVSAFTNTSIHYQHLQHGQRVASAFTSICLFRRSAIEAMGGWDERWFSRYADDVATRFSLPEGSIALELGAQGEHLKAVPLLGLLKHRFNIGYFFVQSMRANRGVLKARPKTAVLDRRFPLNTLSAALAAAGLVAVVVYGPGAAWLLLVPVGVNIAANAGLFRFTLKHRGLVEALACFPLSAIEGAGCFGGMTFCAIESVRERLAPSPHSSLKRRPA